MNMENTYLSEEELQLLIRTVEENELISAPPDLAEHVMASLDDTTQKVKEFHRYCFRVISSIAAAIFIVFTLPNIMASQSEIITESRNITSVRYATKDEALSDRGFFSEAFSSNNLFDNNLDLNLFNK